MAPLSAGLAYTHKLILDAIQKSGKYLNYDDITKKLVNKHHMISELAISKAVDYLVNSEFIRSEIVYGRKVYMMNDKANQAMEYCRICGGNGYALDEKFKVCNVCLSKIITWPDLPIFGIEAMLKNMIADVTPGIVYEARKLNKAITNCELVWNS